MTITSATFLLFFTILVSDSVAFAASVVDDLHNLQVPPDFNSTITNNCFNNPSHRYCNSSPADLPEIFKSTIVASHLCNESKNPNCVETFSKIDLRNRPKIAPLYLSFNFFWKYCPLTILSIDLSNNSLKGEFPSDIFYCSQIQALDLSHNDLFGDVPIQSFMPLTNLTVLNLSHNHFSEVEIGVTDNHFFTRFNSSSFSHSGILPNHHKQRIKTVILLIGFPVSVIMMVGFLCWLCFHRPDYLPSVLQRKHNFTPSMLRAATSGFSRRNLEGKSEGVDVYKGILRDGTEVRIEIYRNKVSHENRKKFVEECKVLVRLSHKNLVRVLGWCNNQNLRAIVSEWTDGENIDMWLSRSTTPWRHRLKILMGVVEGMRYLEEQWPEVGYDLRSCSILLSHHHREPLVSRFRVGDEGSSRKRIYEFGVILLELISNRRPWEEFERGDAGFVEWVRLHYPQNIQKIIDERLKKQNILEQATRGIALGLMCTDLSKGQQPSLNQVHSMMKRVSESHQVSTSPTHRRSHENRSERHGRIQSR